MVDDGGISQGFRLTTFQSTCQCTNNLNQSKQKQRKAILREGAPHYLLIRMGLIVIQYRRIFKVASTLITAESTIL